MDRDAAAAGGGSPWVPGAGVVELRPDDLLGASREEARLYRELAGCYNRLTTLLRERRFDQLAEGTSATQAVLEDLRCLVSWLGPARNASGSCGSSSVSPLRALWAETATVVSVALAARDRLLHDLGTASEETREVLSRLGVGRSVLGRYRSGGSREARIRSLTV